MADQILIALFMNMGASREKALVEIARLAQIFTVVLDEEARQDEIGMIASRIKEGADV
jgi:hypothetical protein